VPALTFHVFAHQKSFSSQVEPPQAQFHLCVVLMSSAGTIKSGGATRRAAKMVVLDVDHPDIEEFIETKVS
jgi:hypothetical protein